MERGVYELFHASYEANWYLSARAVVLTHFIRRVTARYSRPRIVDLGAGTGAILARLRLPAALTVAVEEDATTAELGTRRYGLPFVRAALTEGLPLRGESVDVVLMLDVLEHIDDDGHALREAHRILRPGGMLVASVPAFQSLWSRHDELHHHKRRYSRRRLLDALASAGFGGAWVSYYNMLLFPLVWISRAAERLVGPRGASDYEKAGALGAVLRGIFVQERHVVGRWRLPVGVSLLAVGAKP